MKTSGFCPDLVAVTGDVLDKGCADQSVRASAVQFLKQTVDGSLGGVLPSQRLLLIPGNHDESRNAASAHDRNVVFTQINNELFGVASGMALDPIAPRHEWCSVRVLHELCAVVVLFNSCEVLNAQTGEEHGYVSTSQLDRAASLLDAVPKGYVRIALMHHHLLQPDGAHSHDISIMRDAGVVKAWLSKNSFALVLHGHQHLAWDETYSIRGWHVVVTAGGSLGVGDYGRNAWSLPLGYQMIEIEPGEQRVKIARRSYNVGTQQWESAQGNPTSTQYYGEAGRPVPPPSPVPPPIPLPIPQPSPPRRRRMVLAIGGFVLVVAFVVAVVPRLTSSGDHRTGTSDASVIALADVDAGATHTSLDAGAVSPAVDAGLPRPKLCTRDRPCVFAISGSPSGKTGQTFQIGGAFKPLPPEGAVGTLQVSGTLTLHCARNQCEPHVDCWCNSPYDVIVRVYLNDNEILAQSFRRDGAGDLPTTEALSLIGAQTVTIPKGVLPRFSIHLQNAWGAGEHPPLPSRLEVGSDFRATFIRQP
jgi:hypothetical protein